MSLANTKPRPNRDADIQAFLAQCGWGGAACKLLAADASFRHYYRVSHDEKNAVVMDAPPPWENVASFLQVGAYLQRDHLSVPQIIAADSDNGFLLLEDFGDTSFTKLLARDPSREGELYIAATDALVEITRASNTGDMSQLKLYDRDVYLREVALFAEWFLPQVVGLPRAQEMRAEWLKLWSAVLQEVRLQQTTLVHRDYHADNLFWLAERVGYRAVGMLDFQDALLGDAAYDLASLLEDARRDVQPETVDLCLKHFIAHMGVDSSAFMTRYAVLAAQRNAKIIGIFTRLAVRDGKAHYMNYQPRVWNHFMRDLSYPLLQPIADFVKKHVPASYCGSFKPDSTIGGVIV